MTAQAPGTVSWHLGNCAVICVCLAGSTLAAGCATSDSQPRTVSVSREIVINLKRGISENDLQATLHMPASHEFTARTPTNVIRCVSYCFRKPQLKYYFVLFDG